MEKIGNYTIEAELSSGAFVRAYKVVPSADLSAPEKYLKFYPFSESGPSPPARYPSEAVQLQKELGATYPQSWLPIEETGEDAAGAFFVTPYIEDSLERLLGTVSPDSALLQSILLKILTGLENLEAHAGRDHGNLKPSNILISGSGAIQQRTVLISDPLPQSGIDTSVFKRPDMRALGELIYMLVTRTTSVSSHLRTVPSHARWTSLGTHEDRWKEICSTLLDPGGRFQETGPAGLRLEIEQLQGSRSRIRAIGVALGLAAICLFGALFISRLFVAEEVDHQKLREDCFAYISAYDSWLEAFVGDLGTRKGELDPELRAAFDRLLRQRGDLIRPSQAFGMFFSAQDPEAIPASFLDNPDNQTRIEEAVAFLADLSSVVQKWEKRGDILEYAGQIHSRGWEELATEIQAAAQELTFDETLFDQLVRIQSIAGDAEELETKWNTLRSVHLDLARLNDPFLTHLVGWQEKQLMRSGGLREQVEAVNSALRELDEVHELTRVESFASDYDYGLFLSSLEEQPFLSATPPEVRSWRRHLEEFRRISVDPRTEGFAALKEMEGRIASDLALIAELDLGETYTNLREQLETLEMRRERTAGIPGIERESRRINETTRALQRDFTDLRSQVGEVIREHVIDPAEWLAKWREEPISVSGLMAEIWEARRDAILRPLSREDLERNPARLSALDAGLTQLRDFLTNLDQSLPVPQLVGEDRAVEVDRYLEPLLLEARKRTERALADLMPPSEELQTTSLEAFLARADATRVMEEYATFIASASDFSQRFFIASREIAEPSEPGPGLIRFINEEVLPADGWIARSEVDPARVPVLRAMLNLADLVASEDVPELLQEMTAGEYLTLRWAAWRRLQGLQSTPSTPGDWAQWRDAFLSFKSDLPERLRAGLSGGEFWDRAAGESRSFNMLVAALSEQDVFDGKIESLPLPFQFATFVISLRERINADPSFRTADADRLEAFRGGVLEQAESEFGDDPPAFVAAFLEVLRGFDPEGGGEAVDPAEWGPGSLPQWTVVRADADSVVYQWERFSLPFRLFDIGNGKYAYVCEVEMPVGLVIEWFSQNPDLWYQSLAPFNWRGLMDRRGLATWRLQVEPNPAQTRQSGRQDDMPAYLENWPHLLLRPEYAFEWWSFIPPAWRDVSGTLYPEDAVPEMPGDDHPIQYLPPWLARGIARGLNCQLPTPETYTALHEKGAVSRTANRRDLAWGRQQTHIRETNERLRSSDPPWPDTGIFVPEGLAFPRGRNAQVAVNDDDGNLWFEKVYDGSDPFLHLEGNVAEFAFDPETETFYVTGASALSPAEILPSQLHPLPPTEVDSAYTDVGFRLAFPVPRLAPGAELASHIFNPDFLEGLFPARAN